ncbi:MAG: hypothetical protein ACYTGC_07400, partial [Planctomycetota bacterium]
SEDDALRQRVAFERSLRERVGTLMRSSSAPADLASRVRKALAEEVTPTAAAPSGSVTTSRSWWLTSPRRSNALAVAASLLLVSAAVLWGIFGRPIDSVSENGADLVADALQWVSKEHLRCAVDEDARASKGGETSRMEIQRSFERFLASPFPVVTLDHLDYALTGGGRCIVPGHERSVHLMYRRPPSGGEPAAMVSLFAVPDVGQFDFQPAPLIPGQWYSMGGDGTGPSVNCMTDGFLVIFLVCCDVDDVPSVATSIGTAFWARKP